ncbi:hypothetical protein SH661x_001966 [Planctomicrobium sp. SH661]|uniref:hypothetical protein n=1 Tax=Planctomicrobium sp. SH661 TaxID=3448124 RepID=UPI003F5B8037
MKNDAFLHYNVGDWANYGLAVPNYGDDIQSQNSTIRLFTDTIGRNLQNIMFHTDARLATPPSINTLRRIHKLCIRARTLFAGRAVPSGTPNMESQHAIPAPEQFRVYPVPYFNVRNQWMKEYCGLVLLSLTEAMQHSENAKVLEVSEAFAGQVSQYIQRVYRTMAVDLFNVPLSEASAADFTLSEAQLGAYNPADWFTPTEMIDTVPDLNNWPTEDDLQPLTNGILVSHLPTLGRFPGSIPAGSSSSGGQPTPASSNTSFIPAPGI